MATNRDVEDIDGTFDVDVVGLTDLVEFKSDGDLFYFESNEEFGLFGEDGNPFPNSTYPANGEKESSTNSSLSSSSDKSLKPSPPKVKKTKTWNEMEKDLFLKGLELFGKNWRKISKFMATKTPNQVKQYYQEWAETANVIPEAVNLTNDTSIYLPFSTDHGASINESYNLSSDGLRERECKMLGDPNVLNNSVTYTNGYGSHLGTTDIPMGEGMVVSSLHDWTLGSQVSVTDTEEELPYVSHDGINTIKRLKSSKKEQSKKNNVILSKTKKLNLTKGKKVSKQLINNKVMKANSKTHNIISESKTHFIKEGQIIRLNKNEDEESDVNIDDSEDEDFDDRKFVVNEEPKKKLYLQKSGETFQCLPNDEQIFFSSLTKRKAVSISQYISIKNHIVQHWERIKPVIILPEQITLPKYDLQLVVKIFKYLEENKVINNNLSLHSLSNSSLKKRNLVKKVLPKRVKSSVKEVLNSEILRSNVTKQGGGITLSHDSSGAVIDALHIPESSNSKKQPNSPNVQLLNYLKYNSDIPAPFKLVLYPQAIIPLDLHSHSSYSEVIGLLGGFLDEREKLLHVTLAIPTKSSSSKVDCEMCPLSQTEALQVIQECGMKVVGWYHSHPSFLPNPSRRDLGTQEQLQKWFQKSGVPFTGLIISSYSSQSSSHHISHHASQIRCFILDSKSKQVSATENKAPYQLDWKVQNEFDMEWDNIESSIRNVVSKRNKKNYVNWKDKWIDGITYLDKYVNSLSHILPCSNKEVINLVKDFLLEIVQ